MLKQLKEELLSLIIAFFVMFVVLKIAFFNEPFFSSLRVAFSFFYVYCLPGYALLFYWHENFSFIERFLAGTVMGIALVGIFSYYLGLLGWNVNNQHIVLPLLFIALGFALSFWKKKKAEEA